MRDHAPLGGGDRALVFLVQRARQYDVGVTRGLGQEEIDRDVEFEFLERLARCMSVGQRDERVEADRDQPLDFAAMDRLHDLVGGEPFPAAPSRRYPRLPLMYARCSGFSMSRLPGS